jgi:polysaccharide biosynthesis transport protein
MTSNSIVRAIKHEKLALIAVTAVTLLAGMLVILSLPDKYVSEAKILIERQDTFIQTEPPLGSGEMVDRRLQLIMGTVLSTDSIKAMLVENKLAPEDVSGEALEEASEAFRRHAELTVDNVPVINQYTGKSGMYAQGINIAYEHEDPQVAFDVAESLTKRVLDANRSKGESAAEFQGDFLAEQHKEARERLAAVREEIAQLKNENSLYLPELQPLAIRRYEEIEDQRVRAEGTIAQLNRDLDDVRGELSTSSAEAYVLAPDGTRILGADEQLRLLEAEYARATSRYGPDHPELVRLKSEVEALRAFTKSSDGSGVEAELQESRKQLSAARERYSEDHPDVLALHRQVARLEATVAAAAAAGAPRTSSATNPAYNRIKIREQSIVDSITREKQGVAALDAELNAVKMQLARMPAVEKNLDALTQKAESAQAVYEGIDADLQRLSLSAGMQQADLLDRFILLERPRLATAPSKPARILLTAVLAVLAGTGGLLTAMLLHLYRDRIEGTDDVEELVTLPVYAIPKLT